MAAASQLYLNDGSGVFEFADVGALDTLGLVTSATAADLDDDGFSRTHRRSGVGPPRRRRLPPG